MRYIRYAAQRSTERELDNERDAREQAEAQRDKAWNELRAIREMKEDNMSLSNELRSDASRIAQAMPGAWDGAVNRLYRAANEIESLSAERAAREQAEAQRDDAWNELRAIREAIGANVEKSTLGEVKRRIAELEYALTEATNGEWQPQDTS